MDLFGEAAKAVEQADQDQDQEEEEDDAEPEDDFNAAWEVLDLARAIFEKHQEDSDELKMKLAETYIVLGDVSLETGQYIASLGCVLINTSRLQRNSTRPLPITAQVSTSKPPSSLSHPVKLQKFTTSSVSC